MAEPVFIPAVTSTNEQHAMATMRFLVGCSTMGLGIGSLILGLFQKIFSRRFILKCSEPLGFGVTTAAAVGFANLDQYFECFLLLVVL